jgi:hypothetical protein
MDNPKPAQKPAHLLNDLESIRQLLGDEQVEPPLLIDSLDPNSIPLLSDVVNAPNQGPIDQADLPTSVPQAVQSLRETVAQSISRDSEVNRLDNELRAAAQLIMQDVIDDFVPQIEAELKQRLQARLSRLLPPRR